MSAARKHSPDPAPGGIGLVILLLLIPALAAAMPPMNQPPDGPADREALSGLGGEWAAGAHADTVWFGGSGTGDGTVVRGGVWNWEADSGETPESFPDGDPVGNQYRDGWTFQDRTTRGGGPSAIGAGHWRSDGSYDFDFDSGAFAHRATTHANNGANDGPDPLHGAWSVWIGTNLHLNPEHCGWRQTAGYGDGWSQGIAKPYRFRALPGPGEFVPPPANAVLDLAFFHRYAVEEGFDTLWVEISADGITWEQVGGGTGNGIWNGGERQAPLPGPLGGAATAALGTWPGGEGDLWVRLRLASDSFSSDEADGGDFLYGWQVDDLALRADGVPVDVTDFESGMGGWEPRRFEGFDFLLTGDPLRPAGRFVPLADLACPPEVDCPEGCGLENRVLIFVDKDDCDQNDEFADTGIVSPAFAIGGPTNPDIDGDSGRLIRADVYHDFGVGLFTTGLSFCYFYWPADANHCPYTPPAGAPGAGATFNWSRIGFLTCDYFSGGTGAVCLTNFLDDISSSLPATADSVILTVGGYSSCRSRPDCDIDDSGTPFFDNVRFGVFDPASIPAVSHTVGRYADSFPIADGDIVTMPGRMDGAGSQAQSLGIENPLRWVRYDSSLVYSAAENAAVYLRFRVTPGACQPDLNHAFFAAFPPYQWHAARMDTTRRATTHPNEYMTCFHEDDPRNGTFWTGMPPAVEPCDDILPDGLFTPGTVVHYFFELRDASTGRVTGTFPRGPGQRPITSAENFKDLWLESSILPELDPSCDGTYANTLLVVNDFTTNAVPGRGTVERSRLMATLESLGLDFDVYDVVGTNYTGVYDGIGRREDHEAQVPRPPTNGATTLQLAPYDCIWYTGGLLSSGVMLSDELTLAAFGGHASNDQQKLEGWLAGCADGANRLLFLEGLGWASFIDASTIHGADFLAGRGVDVLARDYAQELAANDLRRCARIAGTALAPTFTGEVFGSGCPDDLPLDVFAAVNGGEGVAHFVESLEDGYDPVDCTDDVARPNWLTIVRRTNPDHACEKSVAMGFAFAEMLPLNCQDQCLFDDYRINGANAELVIDLFQWAGKPINGSPIGVGPEAAPHLANALHAAQPNPAARGTSAIKIRYSVAVNSHVTVKIYNVNGRLVRVLVDAKQEALPNGHEVLWDGRNDAGRLVASGVYSCELRMPGFVTARKIVLLD